LDNSLERLLNATKFYLAILIFFSGGIFGMEKATFAGGCFWCMEPPYAQEKGVLNITVGYTGGSVPNPTYEDVCTGRTGHTEAVEIEFDPALISYEKLLDIFWKNIDPTTLNRQFADAGTQYRTGIYYHSEDQKGKAIQSKLQLEKSGKFKEPIVVEILKASTFYKAEEYHQKYYKKNPTHYKMYSLGSGRVPFLKRTWGNDSKD
jgi:methionine-S-sulfoxide reductase